MLLGVSVDASDGKPNEIDDNDKAYWPKLAIDNSSGAIGIAWSTFRHDDNEKLNQRFCVLTHSEKDGWKISPIRVVDNNGGNGVISFNESEKRFLLVWGAGRLV